MKERVIYNKEVQTNAIEEETVTITEDDIRERIMRDREQEAERLARDHDLETENEQLEKEIEREIRGQCYLKCKPRHMLIPK